MREHYPHATNKCILSHQNTSQVLLHTANALIHYVPVLTMSYSVGYCLNTPVHNIATRSRCVTAAKCLYVYPVYQKWLAPALRGSLCCSLLNAHIHTLSKRSCAVTNCRWPPNFRAHAVSGDQASADGSSPLYDSSKGSSDSGEVSNALNATHTGLEVEQVQSQQAAEGASINSGNSVFGPSNVQAYHSQPHEQTECTTANDAPSTESECGKQSAPSQTPQQDGAPAASFQGTIATPTQALLQDLAGQAERVVRAEVTVDQRGGAWHAARQRRVTASTFYEAAGIDMGWRTTWSNESLQVVPKEQRGAPRQRLFWEKLGILSRKATYAMSYGTNTEPLARAVYRRLVGLSRPEDMREECPLWTYATQVEGLQGTGTEIPLSVKAVDAVGTADGVVTMLEGSNISKNVPKPQASPSSSTRTSSAGDHTSDALKRTAARVNAAADAVLHAWLAGSPDGVIGRSVMGGPMGQGILEVKCPQVYRRTKQASSAAEPEALTSPGLGAEPAGSTSSSSSGSSSVDSIVAAGATTANPDVKASSPNSSMAAAALAESQGCHNSSPGSNNDTGTSAPAGYDCGHDDSQGASPSVLVGDVAMEAAVVAGLAGPDKLWYHMFQVQGLMEVVGAEWAHLLIFTESYGVLLLEVPRDAAFWQCLLPELHHFYAHHMRPAQDAIAALREKEQEQEAQTRQVTQQGTSQEVTLTSGAAASPAETPQSTPLMPGTEVAPTVDSPPALNPPRTGGLLRRSRAAATALSNIRLPAKVAACGQQQQQPVVQPASLDDQQSAEREKKLQHLQAAYEAVQQYVPEAGTRPAAVQLEQMARQMLVHARKWYYAPERVREIVAAVRADARQQGQS